MSMRRSVLLAILSGLIAAEALAQEAVPSVAYVPPADPMVAFLLRGATSLALIGGIVAGARRFPRFGADTDAAKTASFVLSLGLGLVLGVAGLTPPAPLIAEKYPIAASVLGGLVVALCVSAGVTGTKRGARAVKARRVYSRKDAVEVTDKAGGRS